MTEDDDGPENREEFARCRHDAARQRTEVCNRHEDEILKLNHSRCFTLCRKHRLHKIAAQSHGFRSMEKQGRVMLRNYQKNLGKKIGDLHISQYKNNLHLLIAVTVKSGIKKCIQYFYFLKTHCEEYF